MKPASPYNEQGYFAEGLRGAEASRLLADGLPPGFYLSRRSLPPGIMVIEDYLPVAARTQLLEYAGKHPGRPSTVQAAHAGAGGTLTRLSADRITDYVDVSGVADQVHAVLRKVFFEQVEQHYSVKVEWYEQPELLRYRSGGHYSPHADAENWNSAEKTWERAIDRDFSILLYLNDGFRGGALAFPNFGLRLAPKAGMLVVFPSDHRFVHCAEPIEDGERVVLVSWCARTGGRRVADAPPTGAIRLYESESGT